jgi:hypothetical protein
MEREVVVHCVSADVTRSRTGDDVRCTLRDVRLAVDGHLAEVRILDTVARGERTCDTAVAFAGYAVRHRTGRALKPATVPRHAAFAWLWSLATTLRSGECRRIRLTLARSLPAGWLDARPLRTRRPPGPPARSATRPSAAAQAA